ncbi:MAG: hypothetical protein WBB79_10405, partial [Candidatus Macondimonas sp.]
RLDVFLLDPLEDLDKVANIVQRNFLATGSVSQYRLTDAETQAQEQAHQEEPPAASFGIHRLPL